MDQLLEEGAQALGISLTDDQLQMFQMYYELLIAWNRHFNLTTITEYRDVLVKHFLDSLSCATALPDTGSFRRGGDGISVRVIDVGSGAGFPGLPLKIAYPGLHLTLLEATGKKAEFLKAVVSQLGLDHVTVLCARAEDAGRDPAHREVYDLTLARAVAGMSTLAELTLPFARLGGIVIAQKGENPAAEVEAAQAALRILGGRTACIIPVAVSGLPAVRHLVVLDKISPTPGRYPRRPGIPARRPLG
jgi:16S rRNA (guanine527-N7)-methyltransferase